MNVNVMHVDECESCHQKYESCQLFMNVSRVVINVSHVIYL